jgi:chromosome segregation ATPase
VSYRQNKPAIKENLDEIVKIRSELNTNVAPLSIAVQGMIESFNKLSSDMIEVRQGLLIENEETTTQMSMVRGQVQDQSVQVEGNKREISIMSNQIKEAQEAIDVFDQYRKQVNQRLMDMQGQIQDQSANQTTSP